MKTKENSPEKTGKNNSIVVQEIRLVAPDRNRKDVGTLKRAIMGAESIEVPNRYRLMDLYHDVVTIDGHLSGLLEKRTKSVTNKRLTFIDKAGKKVDEMDTLINSSKFERLIEVFMERIYYGCAAVEFVVGAKFDFNEIDRRHIRPESREIAICQYDTKYGRAADGDAHWRTLRTRQTPSVLYVRALQAQRLRRLRTVR